MTTPEILDLEIALRKARTDLYQCHTMLQSIGSAMVNADPLFDALDHDYMIARETYINIVNKINSMVIDKPLAQ